MSSLHFGVVHGLEHECAENQAVEPAAKPLRIGPSPVRDLAEGRAWAANALVEARRDLRATRRWMATVAGVDERLVRNWEANRAPLSVGALLVLPRKVRLHIYAELGRKLGVAA